MVQGRRFAAILSLAAVLTFMAAANAPALDVPSVTTPTVTTPPVTVPSLPPPPAPAPTVTVPNVAPPRVSVPPVSTPAVKTQPSSKQVTVPSPSTGGGSASSGGGPAGGIVKGVAKALPVSPSGAPTGAPAAGTAAGDAVGAGYTTPGFGNSPAAPIFGGTPGGPGGGGTGGPGGPATFAFGIPRSAGGFTGSGGVSALAAAVASLAGCFYTLTPYEQQVLTVRTGIDGRQPLTRGQLAAFLGTSPAAIGRTERGALQQLRGAAQTDGCMPVGSASFASAASAFIGGPFGPVGFVTPGLAPSSRATPGTQETQQPSYASTSFSERFASLENGPGEASLSVLVILAAMLSAALGAMLLEARRQVH